MTSAISNARLAPMIKTVAQNVAPLVKRKNKLIQLIEAQEARYKEMLEKQVAKYKAEYDALVEQQELFEAPIRKLTGGFGTEDLVVSELVETGTDKDGKPIRKTKWSLKYPDTIIPPTEGADDTTAEDPAPEREEQAAPFEGVPAEELPNEEQEDPELPFA